MKRSKATTLARWEEGEGCSPLSDEDRRTLVHWIDLSCPIDLNYDPTQPDQCGYGWMLDDNRPTLAFKPVTSAGPVAMSNTLSELYLSSMR